MHSYMLIIIYKLATMSKRQPLPKNGVFSGQYCLILYLFCYISVCLSEIKKELNKNNPERQVCCPSGFIFLTFG